MRHIFDLKQMNLTEYARAFGLYKQLYFIMQQDRKNAQTMQKRGMIKHDPTSNFKSIVALNDDLNIDRQLEKAVEANQNHFSRKLQKSKIKDLQKELTAQFRDRENADEKKISRMQEELQKAKKDVFTDERKIAQRKQGFLQAKTNIRKAMSSEFEA